MDEKNNWSNFRGGGGGRLLRPLDQPLLMIFFLDKGMVDWWYVGIILIPLVVIYKLT